jgi:hypothetical protein
MGKEPDITLYHFASDVDNKKLSNKQLAKKAEGLLLNKEIKKQSLKKKLKKLKKNEKKK